MSDTMPEPGEQPPAINFEVLVPEAHSAGIYANGFGSWFNQTDFTIDFFVYLPTDQRVDEGGDSYIHQPVQVVSRIKIPPSLLFRLIQDLNATMTNYEGMFGPIVALGDPIPPPSDNQPSAS